MSSSLRLQKRTSGSRTPGAICRSSPDRSVIMDPGAFWSYGPLAVRGIKAGLSKLILDDGLYSIKESIGADVKLKKKHKRGRGDKVKG